jgi:hypothetical protein
VTKWGDVGQMASKARSSKSPFFAFAELADHDERTL